MNRIDAIKPAAPRRDLPPFRSGDTVRVHVNITEGDKQRIQIFEGVVIRRRGRVLVICENPKHKQRQG